MWKPKEMIDENERDLAWVCGFNISKLKYQMMDPTKLSKIIKDETTNQELRIKN